MRRHGPGPSPPCGRAGMTSAGAVPISRPLARGLRALCDRHGIKLIADEVVTGFERTGRWFGSESVGLIPDAMILAKGITGGYAPLGAAVFERAWGEELRRNGLKPRLTYAGQPARMHRRARPIRILKRERLVDRAVPARPATCAPSGGPREATPTPSPTSAATASCSPSSSSPAAAPVPPRRLRYTPGGTARGAGAAGAGAESHRRRPRRPQPFCFPPATAPDPFTPPFTVTLGADRPSRRFPRSGDQTGLNVHPRTGRFSGPPRSARRRAFEARVVPPPAARSAQPTLRATRFHILPVRAERRIVFRQEPSPIAPRGVSRWSPGFKTTRSRPPARPGPVTQPRGGIGTEGRTRPAVDSLHRAARGRHLSPRTEQAYVGWVRRFILFHGKRNPAGMGEPEVTVFCPVSPRTAGSAPRPEPGAQRSSLPCTRRSSAATSIG